MRDKLLLVRERVNVSKTEIELLVLSHFIECDALGTTECYDNNGLILATAGSIYDWIFCELIVI